MSSVGKFCDSPTEEIYLSGEESILINVRENIARLGWHLDLTKSRASKGDSMCALRQTKTKA